jgi:hypothetical protein
MNQDIMTVGFGDDLYCYFQAFQSLEVLCMPNLQFAYDHSHAKVLVVQFFFYFFFRV